MKCPICNNEMKNVMHFESGKNYTYHKCKKCNTQTHNKRIYFNENKDRKE